MIINILRSKAQKKFDNDKIGFYNLFKIIATHKAEAIILKYISFMLFEKSLRIRV